MFPPLYRNSKSHWNKTIHGLIYNALKLFMEMDQNLFGECTSNYKSERLKEKQVLQEREEAWKRITEKAMKNPLRHQVNGFDIKEENLSAQVDADLGELSLNDNEERVVVPKELNVDLNGDSDDKTRAKALRRKSNLPQDMSTIRALESHKRFSDGLKKQEE